MESTQARLERTALPIQLVVAAITVAVIVIAHYSHDLYELHMQEDHFVEWLTAALFAIGGFIRMRRAVTERRVFDGLVALFSFFVAGEEFSWGQRLIGYTPPAWFLSHNVQQEATLHNFAGVFGRPKWSLILVLVGYGLLFPLARRFASSRKLMDRIGATPPPDSLAPWFGMTVVLLIWYPLSYTGEWTELVAAVLFLGAVWTTGSFVISLAAGVAIALALTLLSARRSGGAPALACARAEVSALLSDITSRAGTIDLLAARSLNKRVWTAITDGQIDAAALSQFASIKCDGSIPSSRQRYAVDPWGSSYWVSVEETPDGTADVQVYSLGPNRRRDRAADGRSDEIVARVSIDAYAPGI
ncbi:MAG: hypothetical protein M3365_03955 [Gemmatimonadota bacterium]|nr:hypothetical protein [Gemmatimonadota bacterium]